MGAKYGRFVRELRRYSSDGHSVVDVVRQLHPQLVAIQGQNISPHTFVLCLYKAFDIEFDVALSVRRFAMLGWGGDMSDEELEQLLGRLVSRPDEMTDP